MRKDRVSTFRFVFKIKLHKDDRPLLEYLSSKFNIGKVYPKDISIETISSTWEINTRADLLRLIEILDIHPLNTTKYLDYLLWKEALFIYKTKAQGDGSVSMKENLSS